MRALDCPYCGAPSGGAARCGHCRNPIPEVALAQGQVFACLCGVQAVGRCAVCDTAVCGSHLDQPWHGDPDRPVPGDAVEAALWQVTAVNAGHGEARCARCRRDLAYRWIEWYRDELGNTPELGLTDRLLAIEAALERAGHDAGPMCDALSDALGA